MHGGYGYTIDYPLEQFYRDNRLNAIHEGTNGIQALDLLGRKVVEDEGAGLACLVAAIRATTSSAPVGQFGDWARQLDDAIGRVETVTQKLWRDGEADRALAAASVYLEAFGHVVIAWIWLQQALAALTSMLSNDSFRHTTNHPGVRSPSGCGPNSQYWSPGRSIKTSLFSRSRAARDTKSSAEMGGVSWKCYDPG